MELGHVVLGLVSIHLLREKEDEHTVGHVERELHREVVDLLQATEHVVTLSARTITLRQPNGRASGIISETKSSQPPESILEFPINGAVSRPAQALTAAV